MNPRSGPAFFKAGQSVRARNINPLGHTRLPRYARGKIGKIDRDHGVYIFPAPSADGRGSKRLACIFRSVLRSGALG